MALPSSSPLQLACFCNAQWEHPHVFVTWRETCSIQSINPIDPFTRLPLTHSPLYSWASGWALNLYLPIQPCCRDLCSPYLHHGKLRRCARLDYLLTENGSLLSFHSMYTLIPILRVKPTTPRRFRCPPMPANSTLRECWLTPQIEEALKLYQRALKFHTDGDWDEAHKAYDELFSSDIFQADSLSGDIDDEQVPNASQNRTTPINSDSNMFHRSTPAIHHQPPLCRLFSTSHTRTMAPSSWTNFMRMAATHRPSCLRSTKR